MIYAGLLYSTRMLKGPSQEFIENNKIKLKENDSRFNIAKKKILVLDLDRTLVYADYCHVEIEDPKATPNANPNNQDPTNDNKTKQQVIMQIRPYALEFLKNMAQLYDIVVFEASSYRFTEAIVSQLDPGNQWISYVLDKTYCFQTSRGYYIKDLRIFQNRDLKDIVIVDDLVYSFGLQLDNGVPIVEWKGDENDRELMYLEKYLRELYECDDVRRLNRERLRLQELGKETQMAGKV